MKEENKQEKLILDINEIKKFLPHRYPFLMVDRVVKITDNSIEAIKNISINENYFQGHYPDFPIMPGVLQIEAIAQVGGILALRKNNKNLSKKAIYFMGIDKVRFKSPVVPGDQLIIKVEIINLSQSRLVFSGKTYVKDKVACQVDKIMALAK